MRNLPVHWYEGQFLHPHHFQAAERHWTESSQTGDRWNHPHHYGLQRLEISEEALANQQLEILSLQARMPDGTLVDLESGQEPDRLSIKDALPGKASGINLSESLEEQPVVQVFLALPKHRMGIQNVSRESSSEQSRYLEITRPIQDESAGGNDQEIEFRQLNVRILLSTDDLSGHDVLPIAQIRRSGEGKAIPKLDAEYVPPIISLDAWPAFKKRQVRAVFDMVGQKIEVLGEQISSRGVGLDSRHPGDLDRIMLLSQLNTAYAVLNVLSFTRGIHPVAAYQEMCRIVGQLSVFGADRRLSELPPYDHDDLAPVFTELRNRIAALIESVRDYEYEQRYFEGVGLGMQVGLESKWFNSDWTWYIGVRKGELSDQECRDLLSAGQLDWKLGSARQVEILFRNRAQGLEIRPLQHSVRSLPGDPQWIYYEVPRNDHPAWRDVQETQTLAMRLKDSLIFNRDRLQGERQLIVSAHGRQVPLEFALFAVPAQL